jgi:hypothetical protein
MPLTVKSITLWRKDIANQPGALASTLAPFAKASADLQVVMGYRIPGNEQQAAIELYPVAGKAVTQAAQDAGLVASSIPTLLVEGDNRPGLAHAVAQAAGEAGINLVFLMAQVVGRRYSAVIGFETADDAKKSATIIKRTAAKQKGARKR